MNLLKEIKWLVILYNSPYCRDGLNFKFSPKSGCMSDYERLVGVGIKNWEFRKWFKELLAEDVFTFSGKIYKGHRNNNVSNGYTINVSELVKYAKKNEFYIPMYKFFNRDRVI